MSENTANAGHDNGPTICFGIAQADEKGKMNMPPEYAYAITFRDEDCLVIPLESNQKKKTKTKKDSKGNNKEKEEMIH